MAADGPQVGALGRGLGPLLGAHGLYGGGGLPEGGGVSDGAVPLVAVDIDHIRLNLGLALLPLGKDLGVALIHGIVLKLLHRAGDGLGVGQVLGGLDGQGGDDLLHIEHVAHHQPVEAGLGVELHQVAEGHVVAVGDAVVGVPLHHGVGGFAGGIGLQGLLHLVHAHQVVRRVDGGNGHILHKLGGGGGVGDELGLDAVQHGVQGLLVLHHTHRPAVQSDLVGPQLVAELVELAIEVVADILLPAQAAFQGEGKAVVNLAVHLVAVAQQLTAPGLHRLDGVVHHALVCHNAHLLAVHNDGVAGGIEGGQGEGGAQGPGYQQEGDGSHRQRAGGGAVEQMSPAAEVDSCPLPHPPGIELELLPPVGGGGGVGGLGLLLGGLDLLRLGLGGLGLPDGSGLVQLRNGEPGSPALILYLVHGNHLLF